MKIKKDDELGGYRVITKDGEDTAVVVLPSPFGKGWCVHKDHIIAAGLKLNDAKRMARAIA